jgi:hypothetical protein
MNIAARRVFLTSLLVPSFLVLSAVSIGQKTGAKSDVMSPQFKEQARKAFRAVERLDPDENRTLQLQSAHRAVNGLVDVSCILRFSPPEARVLR